MKKLSLIFASVLPFIGEMSYASECSIYVRPTNIIRMDSSFNRHLGRPSKSNDGTKQYLLGQKRAKNTIEEVLPKKGYELVSSPEEARIHIVQYEQTCHLEQNKCVTAEGLIYFEDTVSRKRFGYVEHTYESWHNPVASPEDAFELIFEKMPNCSEQNDSEDLHWYEKISEQYL